MRAIADRLLLLHAEIEDFKSYGVTLAAQYKEREELFKLAIQSPFDMCPKLIRMKGQGYSGVHCTSECGLCVGTDWVESKLLNCEPQHIAN